MELPCLTEDWLFTHITFNMNSMYCISCNDLVKGLLACFSSSESGEAITGHVCHVISQWYHFLSFSPVARTSNGGPEVQN